MVKCSACNFWYRSGSIQGECRCKKSVNWKKPMLYHETCPSSVQITVPFTLGNAVVKCKV